MGECNLSKKEKIINYCATIILIASCYLGKKYFAVNLVVIGLGAFAYVYIMAGNENTKQESKALLAAYIIMILFFYIAGHNMYSIIKADEKKAEATSYHYYSHTTYRHNTTSGNSSNKSNVSNYNHNSSGSSHSNYSNKNSDPYNAKDYGNEEDFYEDNYDDFDDYDEAEDYWNDNN